MGLLLIIIIIYCVLVFLVIIDTIIQKNKNSKKGYAKCSKCGMVLSEWFKNDSEHMRCYYCGTISMHKSHKEIS